MLIIQLTEPSLPKLDRLQRICHGVLARFGSTKPIEDHNADTWSSPGMNFS
jgi:hypothetical protein